MVAPKRITYALLVSLAFTPYVTEPQRAAPGSSYALLVSLAFTPQRKRKGVSAKSRATSKTETFFDPSLERLAPNFKGHNIEALFFAIRKLIPNKSEYESSETYAKRVDKYLGVGPYAVRYDPELEDIKYDAENEILKFNLNTDFVHAAEVKYGYMDSEDSLKTGLIAYAYGVFYGKDITKSYIASNSFGAKARVKQTKYVKYQIVDNRKLTYQKFELKTSPNDARRIRSELSVLVIGSLDYLDVLPMFTFRYIYHIKPTMTEPEETIIDTRSVVFKLDQVWLVNRHSGEVYEKRILAF